MIIHSRVKRERQHRERLALIASLKPEVEAAFRKISSYYSFSHYITESERMALDDEFAALEMNVKSIVNSKELEEDPDKDLFRRFYNAMSDSKAHKKANNKHFVEMQLSVYSK